MSQAFPSKFLKSEDIGNQRWPLTIRAVQMEEVGDNEHKPIVYFHELEKGLVLNKTNAEMIVQLYGDDTDRWTGQRIEMYATPVQYQGQSKMGLRVLGPAPAMPAHQPMQQPPQAPMHGMPNLNVPSNPPPAAPGMPDPRQSRPVYPAPDSNAPLPTQPQGGGSYDPNAADALGDEIKY
ncbi:hypothetical protein N8569_00730 [bacterium]|nr:hypothetical protein [bacterium]